jgi:hypothetical protein
MKTKILVVPPKVNTTTQSFPTPEQQPPPAPQRGTIPTKTSVWDLPSSHAVSTTTTTTTTNNNSSNNNRRSNWKRFLFPNLFRDCQPPTDLPPPTHTPTVVVGHSSVASSPSHTDANPVHCGTGGPNSGAIVSPSSTTIDDAGSILMRTLLFETTTTNVDDASAAVTVVTTSNVPIITTTTTMVPTATTTSSTKVLMIPSQQQEQGAATTTAAHVDSVLRSATPPPPPPPPVTRRNISTSSGSHGNNHHHTIHPRQLLPKAPSSPRVMVGTDRLPRTTKQVAVVMGTPPPPPPPTSSSQRPPYVTSGSARNISMSSTGSRHRRSSGDWQQIPISIHASSSSSSLPVSEVQQDTNTSTMKDVVVPSGTMATSFSSPPPVPMIDHAQCGRRVSVLSDFDMEEDDDTDDVPLVQEEEEDHIVSDDEDSFDLSSDEEENDHNDDDNDDEVHTQQQQQHPKEACSASPTTVLIPPPGGGHNHHHPNHPIIQLDHHDDDVPDDVSQNNIVTTTTTTTTTTQGTYPVVVHDTGNPHPWMLEWAQTVPGDNNNNTNEHNIPSSQLDTNGHIHHPTATTTITTICDDHEKVMMTTTSTAVVVSDCSLEDDDDVNTTTSCCASTQEDTWSSSGHNNTTTAPTKFVYLPIEPIPVMKQKLSTTSTRPQHDGVTTTTVPSSVPASSVVSVQSNRKVIFCGGWVALFWNLSSTNEETPTPTTKDDRVESYPSALHLPTVMTTESLYYIELLEDGILRCTSVSSSVLGVMANAPNHTNCHGGVVELSIIRDSCGRMGSILPVLPTAAGSCFAISYSILNSVVVPDTIKSDSPTTTTNGSTQVCYILPVHASSRYMERVLQLSTTTAAGGSRHATSNDDRRHRRLLAQPHNFWLPNSDTNHHRTQEKDNVTTECKDTTTTTSSATNSDIPVLYAPQAQQDAVLFLSFAMDAAWKKSSLSMSLRK